MKIKRITLPVIAVIAAVTLAAVAGWLALDNKTHAQTNLSPPANVQVADGDTTGEVVVSWDAVDGATGYSVQWVNVDAALVVYDAGGDWEQYIQSADIDGGETASYTLTVNRPRSGAEYAFAVRSRSGPDTESDWSSWERWILQDIDDVLAATLSIAQNANALVSVGSVPTNASMTRASIGQDRAALARHKASLNEQLPLLEGRGDAMRVASIKGLVGNLIANAEQIQAGRPALLRALAAEQDGNRASDAAELVSSIAVSSDDQFDVLMMDEASVSEADRLRYSHLQSLASNVRLARTLLLVAARLQDPAVVARNQEAYESVEEFIQRDIEYLSENIDTMSDYEEDAVNGAQSLVAGGRSRFTQLEKRLQLTADERALIAHNAVALSQLQANLGALAAEAQGMTPAEIPTPAAPTETPGVTADMIKFGQSAAETGPSSALGLGMKLGINAAFKEANDNGGVHGRQLSLTTRDDMYESDQAFAKTRQLINQDGVFGLIGAVGTPTSRAALPLAEAGGVPFVGAFTGAQLLREDDQDFILNVRASYHDETERMVEYLEGMGKTKVAVLYQNDSYGQDGLEGVRKALNMRVAWTWWRTGTTRATPLR